MTGVQAGFCASAPFVMPEMYSKGLPAGQQASPVSDLAPSPATAPSRSSAKCRARVADRVRQRATVSASNVTTTSPLASVRPRLSARGLASVMAGLDHPQLRPGRREPTRRMMSDGAVGRPVVDDDRLSAPGGRGTRAASANVFLDDRGLVVGGYQHRDRTAGGPGRPGGGVAGARGRSARGPPFPRRDQDHRPDAQARTGTGAPAAGQLADRHSAPVRDPVDHRSVPLVACARAGGRQDPTSPRGERGSPSPHLRFPDQLAPPGRACRSGRRRRRASAGRARAPSSAGEPGTVLCMDRYCQSLVSRSKLVG